MAVDGSLKFDTKVDETGFEKGLVNLEKTGNDFVVKFTKMLKGVASGYAGKKLIEYFIGSNAEMEQYLTSFEVMLGSEEKAIALLENLKTFAAVTPFELTDLTTASQTLLAFGENVNDLQDDLEMLGDISQGNKEKFNSLALVFGQVQSQGRLMGQDLLQMINAGFNPLNVMAERTGKSMSELKDEMAKGNISFEMVADAMRAATSEGGQFYQSMEEQSKTMTGMLSTLGDTFKQFGRDAGEKAFEQVKGKLQELMDYIDEATANGTLDEVADIIGNALNAIISDLMTLADVLLKNKGLVLGVASAYITFKGALKVTSLVRDLSLSFGVLTGKVEAETAAQVANNVAVAANPYGMILSAVSALIVLLGVLGSNLETGTEKANRLFSESKDLENKVSELNSELETNKERIEQIKAQGVITYADKQEIEKLEIVNNTLEAQIKLNEELAKEKAKQAEAEAVSGVNSWTNQATIAMENYKQEMIAVGTQEAILRAAQKRGDKDAANAALQSIEYHTKLADDWKVKMLDSASKMNAAAESIKGYTEEGNNAAKAVANVNTEMMKLTGNYVESGKTAIKGAVKDASTWRGEEYKKAAEKRQEQLKSELEANDKLYEAAEISESEYNKNTLSILTKYNAQKTGEYASYYGKIAKYQKSAAETAARETETQYKADLGAYQKYIESLTSEADKALSDIQSQVDSYAAKLADTSSLYTIDDENGLQLYDIQEKTDALLKYQELIDNVRQYDGSDALVEYIRGLDVDEANANMEAILSGDTARYIADFNKYKETANGIAESAYAEQADLVRTEYADKVVEALTGIPSEAFAAGEDTAAAFTDGLLTQSDKISAALQAILASENFGALAGNLYNAVSASNSADGQNALGKLDAANLNINTPVTVNVTAQTVLDGDVVAESVTEHQATMAYSNGGK